MGIDAVEGDLSVYRGQRMLRGISGGQSRQPFVVQSQTGLTEGERLNVNIFCIRGCIHYTTIIATMMESKGVTKLMNGFFFKSLLKFCIVLRKAVEFIVQSVN